MNLVGQTVCLCMIVKNEAHVIKRCLHSVMPLLDAWVIVDTGSTDDTQELIQSTLHGLPGEVVQRPWVDFAYNRNEALALATPQADFLLIIDADEVLQLDPEFELPRLFADAYDFELLSGTVTYYKTQLVRSRHGWRFQGVIHEHIATNLDYTRERLPGVRTLRIPDGARAKDPLTYRRDALLLETALLTEPDNARHMFYLAHSYQDAGELDLALDRYSKRVAMCGWAEEVWSSLYQIARVREMCGSPWPTVLESYLAAFQYRPDRAEPLFRVGIYYQARKEYPLAYLFFAQAVSIALPLADNLFVERSIYEFFLPLEFAVACFYVGRHQEAIGTCDQLLASMTLTAAQREQVTQNRQFSVDTLNA